MTKTIQLTIQTAADLKGIKEVQKALADIAKGGGNGATAATTKQAAAYTKLQQAAAQVATAEAKKATATSNAAIADTRAATAAQNLATAQARTATATAQAAAAQTRAEQAALRYAQAQDRAAQASTRANSGMAVLPRTIAGLSHEAAAFATASLSMGAAVGVATATINSFAEAFQFKAQLDATTLAINAQLKGVRDQGQVWNEASTFAQRFKLTQEETTNAISASIGVMRASKAPVEDILGVLARMQVLSPEQSLQEAAIALKALASGDTTSLVTRFEVGRDVANQMKAEIQGGADAVQVMGKFLGDIGIGMDVLAAKTTGAAGAMKDLAIAQEELKLAQAEFAQGPGLVLLEAQIRATTGATRLLTGDFEAMGASLHNAITGGGDAAAQLSADMDRLQGVQAETGVTAAVAADAQNAYTRAILEGASEADAAAARQAVLSAATATTAQITMGAADTREAYRAIEQQATAAVNEAAAAQLTAAAAQQASVASLTENITKTQEAEIETKKLRDAQALLASIGAAVAAGQITAGQGALNFAAMTGVAIQQARILIGLQAQLAGKGAASVTEARLERDTPADRAQARAAGAAAARERKEAAETARVQQTLAVGTTQQKIAEYQKQYDAAVRAHGAQSAEAINAQTKLMQAQEKGAKARGSSAVGAASKLEQIEQKTGDKIAEIAENTQQKITEITEREAAKQQVALQKLNENIALAGADRRVSDEADDLDLISADMDEEQAARLNAREVAQAKARESEKRAAEEARAVALAGDAELAEKQFSIRETQIDKQQSLDEKYAEKQRELAGNEEALDAAKVQYDEATRANEEAAQRRIEFAQLEAAQKKQAVEDEKAGVIAAAEDQANRVISAAERSAQGVAKASQTAKDTATANLRAIGDAVNAIPSQKTITITVNQSGGVGAASTGGGGGNKSAGGGNFLTHGPTKLTVGDNPGGVELVTVTPLSGKGQTRTNGSLLQLAGGGVVVVDAGDGYTTPVAGGPPSKGGGKKGKGGAPADNEAIRKAIRESIELVKAQNELRKVQAEAARLRPLPINYAWIEGLATEAQEVTKIVTSKLLPLKKDEAEAFGKYASAVGQSADILKTIAELRTMQAEAKKERPGELVMAYITGLAQEAQKVTQIVRQHLIPETELEAEMYSAYADSVSSAVSVLNDVADLRKALKEPTPPIDIRVINQLVADAAAISIITRERLIPTTEEQADALSLYADAVGSSVSILKDVSELSRDMFADYYSPSDAEIGVLTTDAKRLAQGFIDAARTMDTQTLEGAKLYTDTIGQVLGNTKDLLEVTDRIRFSDLTVDPKNLAQLEESGAMIMQSIAAIGKHAGMIPAGDVAALTSASGAIKSYSDAMVSLAAVPFADMPRVAGAFGAAGAGSIGGGITVNIYNPPSDMNVNAVSQQVKAALTQQTARRY